MYIISRKRVYATHWWENVLFNPDPIWRNPADQTNDEIFQAIVIDMLRNRRKYHPKLDMNPIEDVYIWAYLIRPATAWNAGPDGDASPWTEILYNTLNNDDLRLYAEDGTNGNNIFKYDSLRIFEPGLKGDLAMLCVEDELTPYHEDHW
ncbi:hypothetical protein BDV39DRAFT_199765 [Aspergillus sergii]|uniref:Uncharacterized protein n=1 Tax=Aspergillus sergii TaxID=1034303 RepID=A0A5N6XHP4_9EURO|nr:hypothetical protein BDV39DRAFT_199765 [Aspergillus sergii]